MGTTHLGYTTVYVNASGSASNPFSSGGRSEIMKPADVVVVEVQDAGSFAGTVQLQRKAPGATAWNAVEDGSWTEADLPVTKQIFESHPDTQICLVCTAITAGSAMLSLTVGNID